MIQAEHREGASDARLSLSLSLEMQDGLVLKYEPDLILPEIKGMVIFLQGQSPIGEYHYDGTKNKTFSISVYRSLK